MKNITAFCLLFIASFLFGQEVHFTQFTLAPQSYNPGLIGGFSGTYRVSGIFRDQWFNANVNGYRTVEANIDAPIIKGFRDRDWIGAGVGFNQDVRGSLKLKESISRLGLSYHMGLDKKMMNYVSIGVQFMSSSRSLSKNFDGSTPFSISTGIAGSADPDIISFFQSGGQGDRLSTSYSDWVAGLTYTGQDKNGSFKLGISANHFLKNNVAFKGNREDQPLRLAAFFQMNRMMNKQFSIQPAVLMQTIGKGHGFELSAHNWFGYKLKPESELTLKAGIGARTGTFAAQFLVGADYKGFYGGVAYDMPVNGYAGASSIQNAFEVGIGYIGVIQKRPKPEPIILCPRL